MHLWLLGSLPDLPVLLFNCQDSVMSCLLCLLCQICHMCLCVLQISVTVMVARYPDTVILFFQALFYPLRIDLDTLWLLEYPKEAFLIVVAASIVLPKVFVMFMSVITYFGNMPY